MWTNVSKPNSSSYTKVGKPAAKFSLVIGQATGVLGPPTYSTPLSIMNWSDISKPVSSSWTKVSKPT